MPESNKLSFVFFRNINCIILLYMQNTKIAFDLGGVIIERGALENYLVIDSIVSVKLAVMKFGSENVYIMSKAK